MKRLFKLLLILLLSITLISCEKDLNKPPITPPTDEKPIEPPVIPPVEPELGYEDEIDVTLYDILEEGLYITRNEVALYIFYYDKLPSNYLTKSEAGGSSNIKNLWTKENMKSIGGDTFGNREGLLPNRPYGSYKELDIGYKGVARGALRIVYNNKDEIYYTSDHYDSFIWLDTEVMEWTSYSLVS